MANENMIQKHVDNFLAKISGGATPVDTNVRNSKEFWLDKIADWTAGKSTDDASTKKLYWHGLDIYSTVAPNSSISAHIISTSPDAINTIAKLVAWFNSITGQVDLGCSGIVTINGESYTVHVLRKLSGGSFVMYGARVYPASETAGVTTLSIGNASALASLFPNVSDATNSLN